MQYYILSFLATILLAADFVLQKLYQKTMGISLETTLFFNAGIGMMTAVLFYFLNGCHVSFSVYEIGMALGMSLCLLGYTVLGFRIMNVGNLSFYTMFLMMGGMIVPYLWGVLFLNESFTGLRLIGLFIIGTAIVVSNYSKTDIISGKILILCVGIFFLNGGSSVISKTCQTPNRVGVIEPIEFVFWTGITRFVLCMILLIVRCKKMKMEFVKISEMKILTCLIAASAVVNGISYLFQLTGAAYLPATVLYPIISGGTIVFSAFAGIIFFKEKLNGYQWAGVILCCIGTCFFL